MLPFEFRQCFSCKILIGERTIDDGCVEKCHAAFHGFVQQTDTLLFVRVLATVISHAHYAETK